MRYLAIDYETANAYPTSICCAGYALFEDRDLIDHGSYYCKPVPYEFDDWNMAINGITRRTVNDKPRYDLVHEKLMQFDFDFIIAHNSEFDIRCMVETSKYYNIHPPKCNFLCTMVIASQILGGRYIGLGGLSKLLNIDLSHHLAESDAIACGTIFDYMYHYR